MENCINSDLANNYGNLCQRVLAFCEKNCDFKIPEYSFENEDLKYLNSFDINKTRNYVDVQNINSYINFIFEILFSSNKYFNDQSPWKKKDNKRRLDTIVYVALELIRKITILLYPVIPETSLKVLKVFDIDEKDILIESIDNHNFLLPNKKLNKLNILFQKIDK